jgi:hypothetical protein
MHVPSSNAFSITKNKELNKFKNGPNLKTTSRMTQEKNGPTKRLTSVVEQLAEQREAAEE